MAVTASWILSSLYHCTMQAPPFPTFPCNDERVVQRPAKVDDSKRASLDATVSTKKITVQSHVFAGSIFVIVRPKSPHGTMSFEKHDMESLITTHGGLLLTKHLFGAIQMDLANPSQTSHRKFHLLSTGGYSHDPTNLDPLLAQLSKLGVQIIPVTPVWIKACVGDRVRYDARQYPLLFQPQSWPVRLLPPHPTNTPLLVSLTGFVDASRYGIIWMLKEIGAGYTDNLTSKNSHLICKDAAGKKYEKACEWGLHVVSVEWLYHVMRYGYEEGCEGKFSLGGYDVAASKSESNKKKRVCSDWPSMETFGNDKDVATKAQETPDGGVAPHASLSISHNGENNRVSSSPPSRTSDKDSSVAPATNETSNNNVTPKPPKSPENVNKRFHSALQSLETSNPNTFPRRSQRRRIPILDTEYSPSLFTQEKSPPHDKDEELERTEQFTIRVDADVGTTFPCADDVPTSQVNDAEEIGESQVVWFAERRAR
jgi:topoisomerase (DNA) II binding protein 1